MTAMRDLHCSGCTSLEVYESRPEVGSSRKRTQGSVMSAMPMLTRLRCSIAGMPQPHVLHQHIMHRQQAKEVVCPSSTTVVYSSWQTSSDCHSYQPP